jgi:ribosomal protein S18 acetylase RimI-like enzyme
VVNILVNSFDDNKSVNYIIKQDKKRVQRIRALMEYSFDICHLFGDVFLTDDKNGCALIVLPDKKKLSFKSIILDAKLVINSMGLSNTKKAMYRESKIKKEHPKDLIYYLWFIGVEPNEQNKGIGSLLLEYVINEGLALKRKICLETSTMKNIPWYKKHGFSIYKELDFSYRLYFMKRE